MPVDKEQKDPGVKFTKDQTKRKHETLAPEANLGGVKPRVIEQESEVTEGRHVTSEEGGESGRRRKATMDAARAAHDQPHSIVNEDGSVTKSKRRTAKRS